MIKSMNKDHILKNDYIPTYVVSTLIKTTLRNSFLIEIR